MGAVGSAWQGSGQEDAHEFLTALLEQVQQEVLSAEVQGGMLLLYVTRHHATVAETVWQCMLCQL